MRRLFGDALGDPLGDTLFDGDISYSIVIHLKKKNNKDVKYGDLTFLILENTSCIQ